MGNRLITLMLSVYLLLFIVISVLLYSMPDPQIISMQEFIGVLLGVTILIFLNLKYQDQWLGFFTQMALVYYVLDRLVLLMFFLFDGNNELESSLTILGSTERFIVVFVLALLFFRRKLLNVKRV